MTDLYFKNAQELIDAFGITNNPNYSGITELTDRKAGFSIQRNYPNDILYIPLVSKDGEVDSVALIHVVYSHPSEDSPDLIIIRCLNCKNN